MKIIRSFPSLANNWSFGMQVRRDRTIDDLLADKTVIEKEHVFAGCSGYTRVALSESKFIFQVPKSYFVPKYSTPEFFKKWEAEMALMGGNAKYLGDYPYLGNSLTTNPVACYNKQALKTAKGFTNFPLEFFMTENVWSTWEVDAAAYQDKLKTYHSFCLFRYLWSWHYVKIIDVYFDIKSRLTKTKPEPVEMLQLAYYSYDPREVETKINYGSSPGSSFSGWYGHMNVADGHTFYIRKWNELKGFVNGDRNINDAFGNNQVPGVRYCEVNDLINQRKYKAAYDKLKKA